MIERQFLWCFEQLSMGVHVRRNWVLQIALLKRISPSNHFRAVFLWRVPTLVADVCHFQSIGM
jgi:hypothetical protein